MLHARQHVLVLAQRLGALGVAAGREGRELLVGCRQVGHGVAQLRSLGVDVGEGQVADRGGEGRWGDGAGGV
jgi:hypothetical protein